MICTGPGGLLHEGVKRAWQQAEVPGNPSAVRYVLVEDLRAAAAMRSLALPGWGQLYKGENTKGWILLGVWGMAASGTVLAHIIRKQAEDDYLAATEALPEQEILDRFDRFNTWHKARNNLALATAGLWAYSYLDALIFRGSTDVASHRQFALLPAPAPAYAHIHFRLRF